MAAPTLPHTRPALARRATRARSSEIRDLLRVVETPGVLSLAGGLPSPGSLPAARVRRALDVVLDQTRRHGYLLHLLGVKQVAVVVNKMDRVEFSRERFQDISDEISSHLIGLGVTPSAVMNTAVLPPPPFRT